MNTQQLPEDVPAVQDAIYGVALSLDSFLLNGIPCGVFQDALFPGFLEKVAGHLLRDLAILERQAADAPGVRQPRISQTLAALRASCQQLIDRVAGLRSFRALPLPQVRAAVAQVAPLREECVQQLQELEVCLRTPQPFYQSRPGHSATAIRDFLAGLPRLFEEEWAVSRSGTGQAG